MIIDFCFVELTLKEIHLDFIKLHKSKDVIQVSNKKKILSFHDTFYHSHKEHNPVFLGEISGLRCG